MSERQPTDYTKVGWVETHTACNEREAALRSKLSDTERERDVAVRNAETVARNATTSGEAQRRRIAHLEGVLRDGLERFENLPDIGPQVELPQGGTGDLPWDIESLGEGRIRVTLTDAWWGALQSTVGIFKMNASRALTPSPTMPAQEDSDE